MIKKITILVGVMTLAHGCASTRQRARQNVDLAQQLCEKQEWQLAIDKCSEALEIDPRYSYAYDVRGMIKFKAGHDPVDCLKDLDRGLSSGGGMKSYLWRAYVRFRIEDYEGVIKDCNRSIRYADAKGLSPDFVDKITADGTTLSITWGAGTDRYYSKKRDEAITLRNRAQALIPLQSSEP